MRPVAAEAAPSPPPRPDGSFDTNMVVILAALLTALVCALGLNSIVRCALRCGWRGVVDAPKGMGRRALRRMPVSEYEGAGGVECPICLGEFRAGEKVRVLPRCHHAFHLRCIDTWLEAHASCPTCRQCLVERREKAPPQLAREPMVGSFVI